MGLNLESAFALDDDAELNGKWFPIGNGARIRVKRFGNKDHKRIMDRLREPFKPVLLRGGNIPEEDNERILIKSAAEGLLVDWEGIIDNLGEEMPYSPEAALEAFDRFPEFLDLVSRLALDSSNFRRGVQDDTVKT